jgi:hypothetical protein
MGLSARDKKALTAGMDKAEKPVVQPFIDRTVARTLWVETVLNGRPLVACCLAELVIFSFDD